MSIYSADEQDLNVRSLSIIGSAVMRILESQVKDICPKLQNNQTNPRMIRRNLVLQEIISDFLAGLTQESTGLQKQYKREITEVFSHENFFLLSKRALRKWQ